MGERVFLRFEFQMPFGVASHIAQGPCFPLADYLSSERHILITGNKAYSDLRENRHTVLFYFVLSWLFYIGFFFREFMSWIYSDV